MFKRTGTFLSFSKDASSVEEVDEGSVISEGTPPLVPPREDSGLGESAEEFQVGTGHLKLHVLCHCRPWGITD